MSPVPRSGAQALLLVAAGAVLGFGGDVLLPDGILARRDVVLRDLELLVPVHLWRPEDVLAAAAGGELYLLDARPAADFERAHAPVARNAPLEEFEELLDALAPEVAGREVVVALPDRQFAEARTLAQRLVTDLGAARVGTVEGGFEALDRCLGEEVP